MEKYICTHIPEQSKASGLKTKIRCQPLEAEVAASLVAAFEACE
jgi:hypothetical protein